MLLLAFADVQGNPWCAEAILLAAKRLGEAEVYCLGNAVGEGPEPGEAVALLRKKGVTLLAGNHDRAALGQGPASTKERGEWNLKQLASSERAYLRLAAPPRRFIANGKRILLTPEEHGKGADVVIRPGPRPLMERTPTGWLLVTGRADDPSGEAPFVTYDTDSSEARLHYAAWDTDLAAASSAGRTRHV